MIRNGACKGALCRAAKRLHGGVDAVVELVGSGVGVHDQVGADRNPASAGWSAGQVVCVSGHSTFP